jgi:uncharacterized membrane protein YeaQ/YmgE (transglycosylase-associated protein family)
MATLQYHEKSKGDKAMQIMPIIIMLAIGAVAGWLAGFITKGRGFGLIGDIVLGILGAFVGQFVFGWLHISVGYGLINTIVTATVGAIVPILFVRVLRKIF